MSFPLYKAQHAPSQVMLELALVLVDSPSEGGRSFQQNVLLRLIRE